MRITRHRLAHLAAALAATGAAFAFSGCHQILQVTFGDPDPPVHQPPPPAKKRAVAAGGSGGTTFTGVADGELAARATIRHGFVKTTIRNARFAGTFRATPATSDAELGALSDASWAGRLTAVRDRRNQKVRMKGLILATFADPSAGRACLRLTYRNVRKKGRRTANRKRGTGVVKVLGGEGGAQTLGGSARVKVRLTAAGGLRLSGVAMPRDVPARGLNAACTKLRAQVGLAPL